VPLSSDVDRVRPPRLPLALGRRLRAFGPSIVVAGSFSFSGMAAAAYAARHRVPFGLWNGDVAHQLHNRSYAALRARQRRRLAGRAAFGIAYGWHAVRYLGDLAPQLPAVIARNTSVTAVAPEHDAGGNSGRELLAVADLSVPEKGFETIAAALRLLDDPAYRLRVIGNPPADAAAHDPRIEFLGPLPHDQVRAAFARSDIFLFPSRMDIFGLALPEAMAAGRPAITSGVPGAVGDLAVPGANCVLVPARDPRAWAAAIDELSGDPGRRAALGAAAQATVRRRWTMAHAVEATMAGLRLGALCAGEAA
jgi:glycosyltransferase involved in cell wall biosynthesis